MQKPLIDIVREILKDMPKDADSKDILERTRDILNGYDTLDDNQRKDPISTEDVKNKIDGGGELSSMEKYLLMIKGMNK